MINGEHILRELLSGVMAMGDITAWIMFLIGGILIYLGVKKDYEPVLPVSYTHLRAHET